MKITPRELIFFVLLFCLPLATYMLVFKPRDAAEKVLNDDVSKKQELRNAVVVNRVKAVGNIEEDFASLISLKDKAAARLPESEDVGPVVQELSKIAETNKLKISKMQSVPLNDKERLQLSAAKYGIQRLDVELDGNYMGFYQFLLDMEKQPRIIRVQNLDIQRIDENDRQGDIKVRMDLRVYYSKPKPVQVGVTK